MAAFLIGFLLSSVAAIPALLMAWGGRQSEFKQRLKLWAVGLGIRFLIIGGGVIFLFTQTALDRIPTVIGVGVAWLISFVFESYLALRGP